MLGPDSQEYNEVLGSARSLLERLADDPLYYTVKIADLIVDLLSDEAEMEGILARLLRIAERAESRHDFERARAYYGVAIKYAMRLQHFDDGPNHTAGGVKGPSILTGLFACELPQEVLIDTAKHVVGAVVVGLGEPDAAY